MSKFNAKKVIVDGIKFDSEVESKYYAHLKRLKSMGEVEHFELQPSFVLQDKFTKHGKTHKPIIYKADFKVWFSDGTVKVIDVKGMKLPEFKLKEKLFAKKFDTELICICYSKIDGGWIEYDALQKARAKRKKEKEAKEKKIVTRMKDMLNQGYTDESIHSYFKRNRVTKAVATRLLKEAKKGASK